MSSFLFIILYLMIGFILKYFPFNAQNLATYLNKFVIYISLPAMILLQIPKLNFDTDTLIPIAVSWMVMVVSALIVFAASKKLRFSKNITGALMLVTVLGNTSFVGIPLIKAYFGTAGLPYLIVYDQLGTFLALSTYGTIIASYYSHKSESNLGIILKKMVLFPPFFTLILAMLIKDVTFVPVVTDTLQLLAATIIPFALVAVGLQLQLKLPTEEIKPFVFSLGIKLFIAPLIAIFVCYIFEWRGLSAHVSIMEAAMPPMITAAAMASMLGLAPRLSNAIVGYGIFISFVTTYLFYLAIK